MHEECRCYDDAKEGKTQMQRDVPAFEANETLHEHGMRNAPLQPGVIVEHYDGHDHTTLVWDDESFRLPPLGNENLPVSKCREEITRSVIENPVTIIVAQTGAGKSTQVPQYLNDTGVFGTVWHTQPRRVAARGVYERIGDEIGDKRGIGAKHDSVKYMTGGGQEGPDNAPIRVVTDGLQLVLEMNERGTNSNDVIIIDEVHEWNSNIELLVGWTKKAIQTNPNLRVVIMSATVDAERIADFYYKDDSGAPLLPLKPSIIEVPGDTHHPLSREELPGSDVATEIVSHINAVVSANGRVTDEPSNCLVFLPGKQEILLAMQEVRRRLPQASLDYVKLLPLHAMLSPDEQEAALTDYAETVQVVFATDVAETSLTPPGVSIVIDSGLSREVSIDEQGVRSLQLKPISRARVSQRAGRTGRICPGTYKLTRLDEKTEYVPIEDRAEFPIAEFLRTNPSRNILRLKDSGIEFEAFSTVHKVSSHILELARTELHILGATDHDGTITRTGREMNSYPLGVTSARMVAESLQFNAEIRAYVAAIAACKEVGGLQYFAPNVGQAWRELTDETVSDLFVQLDLFIAANAMDQRTMILHDLDINNHKRAIEFYTKISRGIDAYRPELKTPTPEQKTLLLQCIVAGHTPYIYRRVGNGQYMHLHGDPSIRELSKRSLVKDVIDYVVAEPYNVQVINKGTPETLKCLENVTSVSAQQLGIFAVNHTEWVVDGYKNQQGKFVQIERQRIFGTSLGIYRETAARPDPELRRKIIDDAIKQPGKEQRKLRKIKEDLESLAHRSAFKVRQLSQKDLEEFVSRAAPNEITTPATIEDNLRIALADVSLYSFISPEEHKNILKNSPDFVEVDGYTLQVRYRNGAPSIHNYPKQAILDIKAENLYLDDGRIIRFAYRIGDRNKKMPLSDIRDLMQQPE